MKKNEKNLFSAKLLGERLKKSRVNKGFSQTDLAKMLGFKTSASLSNIEKGKSLVDTKILCEISCILDIDLHWLITGEQSPEVKKVKDKNKQLSEMAYKYIARQIADLLEHKHDLERNLKKAIESGKREDETERQYQEFIERWRLDIRQAERMIEQAKNDEPILKDVLDSLEKLGLIDEPHEQS